MLAIRAYNTVLHIYCTLIISFSVAFCNLHIAQIFKSYYGYIVQETFVIDITKKDSAIMHYPTFTKNYFYNC